MNWHQRLYGRFGMTYLTEERSGEAKEAAEHSIDDIFTQEYWLKICPLLHIGQVQQVQMDLLDDEEIEVIRRGITESGYFLLPPEILIHAVGHQVIQNMAQSIVRLINAGYHPWFLCVFDEPWFVLRQLETFISRVTNTRVKCNFDFLAWYIDPRKEASGFSPHRDRQPEDIGKSFDGDVPLYVTCWIPLTDAVPENGCLYVIPKQHDPGYMDGDENDPMVAALGGTMSEDPFRNNHAGFQNIRAVPCSSGSCFIFSHRLIHWGCKSQKDYPLPRIAMAFAFSDPDYEPAYILQEPGFEERLGLAAGQAISYHKRYGLDRNMILLCFRMFSRVSERFSEYYRKKINGEYQWYEFSRKAEKQSSVPVKRVEKRVEDVNVGVDDEMIECAGTLEFLNACYDAQQNIDELELLGLLDFNAMAEIEESGEDEDDGLPDEFRIIKSAFKVIEKIDLSIELITGPDALTNARFDILKMFAKALPIVELPVVFDRVANLIVEQVQSALIHNSDTSPRLDALYETAERLALSVHEGSDQNRYESAVMVFVQEALFNSLNDVLQRIAMLLKKNKKVEGLTPLMFNQMLLDIVPPVEWYAIVQAFSLIDQDKYPLSNLLMNPLEKLASANVMLKSFVVQNYCCALLKAAYDATNSPMEIWLSLLNAHLDLFDDSWYAVFTVESTARKYFRNNELLTEAFSSRYDASEDELVESTYEKVMDDKSETKCKKDIDQPETLLDPKTLLHMPVESRRLIYVQVVDLFEQRGSDRGDFSFSRVRESLQADKSFEAIRNLLQKILAGILPKIQSPRIFLELMMILIGIICKLDKSEKNDDDLDLEIVLHTAKNLFVRIPDDQCCSSYWFAVHLFLQEFLYENLVDRVQKLSSICQESVTLSPLELDEQLLVEVTPVDWHSLTNAFTVIQDVTPHSILLMSLVNKLMTLNAQVESNILLVYACDLFHFLTIKSGLPKEQLYKTFQRQLEYFDDSWYAVFVVEITLRRSFPSEYIRGEKGDSVGYHDAVENWKKDYNDSHWLTAELFLMERRDLEKGVLDLFQEDGCETVSDLEDAVVVLYNCALAYPKYSAYAASRVYQEMSTFTEKLVMRRKGRPDRWISKQDVFRRLLVRSCEFGFSLDPKNVPKQVFRRIRLALSRFISYLFLRRLVSPGLLLDKVMPPLLNQEYPVPVDIECLLVVLSLTGQYLDKAYGRSRMDTIFGSLQAIRANESIPGSLKHQIDRITLCRQEDWNIFNFEFAAAKPDMIF